MGSVRVLFACLQDRLVEFHLQCGLVECCLHVCRTGWLSAIHSTGWLNAICKYPVPVCRKGWLSAIYHAGWLSAIHNADWLSAIYRLQDMQVECYLQGCRSGLLSAICKFAGQAG